MRALIFHPRLRFFEVMVCRRARGLACSPFMGDSNTIGLTCETALEWIGDQIL